MKVVILYSPRPKLVESYSILGCPKLVESFLFIAKYIPNHSYFILSPTLFSYFILLYFI